MTATLSDVFRETDSVFLTALVPQKSHAAADTHRAAEERDALDLIFPELPKSARLARETKFKPTRPRECFPATYSGAIHTPRGKNTMSSEVHWAVCEKIQLLRDEPELLSSFKQQVDGFVRERRAARPAHFVNHNVKYCFEENCPEAKREARAKGKASHESRSRRVRDQGMMLMHLDLERKTNNFSTESEKLNLASARVDYDTIRTVLQCITAWLTITVEAKCTKFFTRIVCASRMERRLARQKVFAKGAAKHWRAWAKEQAQKRLREKHMYIIQKYILTMIMKWRIKRKSKAITIVKDFLGRYITSNACTRAVHQMLSKVRMLQRCFRRFKTLRLGRIGLLILQWEAYETVKLKTIAEERAAELRKMEHEQEELTVSRKRTLKSLLAEKNMQHTPSPPQPQPQTEDEQRREAAHNREKVMRKVMLTTAVPCISDEDRLHSISEWLRKVSHEHAKRLSAYRTELHWYGLKKYEYKQFLESQHAFITQLQQNSAAQLKQQMLNDPLMSTIAIMLKPPEKPRMLYLMPHQELEARWEACFQRASELREKVIQRHISEMDSAMRDQKSLGRGDSIKNMPAINFGNSRLGNKKMSVVFGPLTPREKRDKDRGYPIESQ